MRLRAALALAPQPLPDIPGVPLSGGLVGYTAYDPSATSSACRAAVSIGTETPTLTMCARALAASSSIHLTAPASRCSTTGSEAERLSLRREIIPSPARRHSGHSRAALRRIRRGACRRDSPGFSPAVPSLPPHAHAEAVRRAQEYIASGDVYQLVLAVALRKAP